MSKIKDCPDCGMSLSISLNRCACGWYQEKNQVSSIADYQCHYRNSGERCKETGNMSHSRKGEWYCSEHYHQVRNKRLRIAESKSAQDHHGARVNWKWGLTANVTN